MEEKNVLQIFVNPEFGSIRGLSFDNEPWMVGEDIAIALEYADIQGTLDKHVDSEDKQVVQMSGNKAFNIPDRELTLINKTGLYALIFYSESAKAKGFKRWVNSEVLPAIQKRGKDEVNLDSMTEKEILSKGLLIMREKIQEQEQLIKRLQAQITLNKSKVLFANAIAESNYCIPVSDLAKILKRNGVKTNQKRLLATLRKLGYLTSQQGPHYNMPTKKALDMDLFKVKEKCAFHHDGHLTITKTIKVTGVGQQFFIRLFLQQD